MRIDARLLQGLSIQVRVLHALILRELITRFGRENLGVLWLVVEPLLFTVGVATLWTATGLSHGSSLPIVAFAVTGYSSVLMWRNSASHCAGAVEINKTLLYHQRVHITDVLLARCALEISGATCSFALLTALLSYFGLLEPPSDLLKVMQGWLMLAWFGASLGILIGAATAFSRIVERLWTPVAYLLFPISGAAYMVEWLPHSFQQVVLYLPMVHGIELVREGYFGGVVRTHHDIGYMAFCCLILSLAGFWLAREATHRIEL
jgi:capsular polysaccharide transport system permease protein